MKIYFAGEGYEDIQSINKANVLISFFYMNFKKRKENLKKKYGWNSLFIDSGAFSAWSSGVKINIHQYIDYIKRGTADYYAVLDVIGDAEGTYKNQMLMEKEGVKPLPCFHYGEDWKYLDIYCKNYDYVCLGGMVPISTPELSKWLDVVFAKYPKQKFHGFGLTSTKLMMDYSWHSVDSSTWIVHMKFNELNHYKLGRLYLGRTKEEFNKLIKDKKNELWIKAAKDYGIKFEDLWEDYRQRTNFNLKSFKEIEDYINKTKPYKKRDYQDVLDVEIPRFKLPTLDKSREGVQMNLKNMSLNRLTQHHIIYHYVQCIECEHKWGINPDSYEKQCPKCNGDIITTPQRVEELEWW